MTKLETLMACLPDAPFKQHLTAEIESLRAQLAEVTMERDEWKSRCENLMDRDLTAITLVEQEQQLLATQAHAARLVEMLGLCRFDSLNMSLEDMARIKAALSAPINLDALHEDRARTLEAAAMNVKSELDIHVWENAIVSSDEMQAAIINLAAAHRARKENKNG